MKKKFSPHGTLLISLLIIAGSFAACSNKQGAKTTTFGEINTDSIAKDTAMQVNMDLSYEYTKALALNDTTVFDFLAYDRPVRNDPHQWEGKFILIRRTRGGQDTVIKANRTGPVTGLSLADLDHDGQPELTFYENQTAGKDRWLLRVFRHFTSGKYEETDLHELDAKSPPGHYRGRDTFFVYENHLIRRFPYYEQPADTASKGRVWQSYSLTSGRISLDNEKMDK